MTNENIEEKIASYLDSELKKSLRYAEYNYSKNAYPAYVYPVKNREDLKIALSIETEDGGDSDGRSENLYFGVHLVKIMGENYIHREIDHYRILEEDFFPAAKIEPDEITHYPDGRTIISFDLDREIPTIDFAKPKVKPKINAHYDAINKSINLQIKGTYWGGKQLSKEYAITKESRGRLYGDERDWGDKIGDILD